MIKNYKLFKESLLNKMVGPSDEEMFKHYIDNKKYTDLLYFSLRRLKLDMFKYAYENGADKKDLLQEIYDNDFRDEDFKRVFDIVDINDFETSDVVKYFFKLYMEQREIIVDKLNFNNKSLITVILRELSYKVAYKTLDLFYNKGLSDELIVKLFKLTYDNNNISLLKYMIENYNIPYHYNDDEILHYVLFNSSWYWEETLKLLSEQDVNIYARYNEIIDKLEKIKVYNNDIYNLFKKKDDKNMLSESLLNKLEGPSEQEVLNNFLKQSPRLMLRNSAKQGFMLGVEKALEKGVDVKNDYSVLGNAIEGNNIDIVKLLVSKGAKLSNFSMYFIDAVKNGNLEMIKYIQSLGGKLNFRIGVTDPYTFQFINKDLMEYAAYYGYADIIDYLVKNGFDVNSPHVINPEKKPLYVALENHRVDAVKTLLKHGAEVSAEVQLLLLQYDYKKYQSIFNEYKNK